MKCQNPNCDNQTKGRSRTCSPKCRKALYRLEKPTAEVLKQSEEGTDLERAESVDEMWDKLNVPENENGTETGQLPEKVGQSGTLAERLANVETVQERLAKTRPKGPWDLSVARDGKIEYLRVL
jgi:hypothetical protein